LNLQQLPSKTTNPRRFDYKFPIKRQFISRFENGVLVQADFSALEMRILALASKDESMTRSFLEGIDMHKQTASIVHEISIDDVTAEQRQKAKEVAFG
jgi:DNA polymerase I-like protein with 3'-5' exonuclease and polymerase domains